VEPVLERNEIDVLILVFLIDPKINKENQQYACMRYEII